MTNEQYLIVSYFCIGTISVVIGVGAYIWLRVPMHGIAVALPWKAVREILVRFFPVGILLPAFMGFITVSYIGCEVKDYNHVIASRPYLVSKNQEQISASLNHVVWAVFAWCALLAILLAAKRRSERRSESGSNEGG